MIFLEELKKNNIFDTEFPKDGLKVKPTLEDYHKYALKMIDAFVMDPYPVDEFLKVELEIFKNSGKEFTESNFREELQKRDGSNGGEFSVDSPEVEEFIKNNFNQ